VHKLSKEEREAIRNSSLFDADWYLESYPDVKALGMDPLEHFVWLGRRLGRKPNANGGNLDCSLSEGFERLPEKSQPVLPPVTDAQIERDARAIAEHFDEAFYRRVNGDDLKPDDDALRHFLTKGVKEGRNPTPYFDVRWYLARYQDVKKRGMNPFVHYVKYGRNEGRQPNPQSRVAQSRSAFRDFPEYLRYSLLCATVEAPFTEEHKRCFATMEKIRKELCVLADGVDRLVSIVMPAYNRADTISEAIDSVLAQTYPHFELIVVDDGSTDATRDVVRSYRDERVRLIPLGSRHGVSAARNAALREARGDFITYLDSDNLMDRHFLRAFMGAFYRLPDAEAIYCAQYVYEGPSKRLKSIRFGAYNKSALRNHNYIDLNTFMHKADVLSRAGMFDESLRRLVDWDFIERISETCKMYSAPLLLSHYRLGAASNSITLIEDYRLAEARIREKQHERAQFQVNSGQVRSLGRPLTVVIPNYQSLEYLQNCIASIKQDAGKSDCDIIVVDNASNEEVRNYLQELDQNHPVVRCILCDANYGFTHAVNIGIENAKPGRDILILNNDAVLVPGALAAMQDAALSSDDVGVVVPQQLLPAGERTISVHAPDSNPSYEADVSLSIHHNNIARIPCFHDGELVELTFAPFFCVYVKRSVLDALHGLDAEFGRHYRSDRVFCNMVHEYLGRRIVYTPRACVYHMHQQATRQLKQYNPDEHRQMYQENIWPHDLMSRLGYNRAAWE